MLARAQAWLDRAAFSPQTLPDGLVTGFALVPPIVAGSLLFKLPALTMLAVALVIGLVGQLVARWLWRTSVPRPQATPLIAAVVGVALVGPGAPLVTTASVAMVAVVLELIRARATPAVRAQSGLIAFGLVAGVTMLRFSGGAVHLATSATAAYLNPSTQRAFADPIGIWIAYFGGSAAPIDPIRLYVGNVGGPVFATSLLAIAMSTAWLWYAQRLSLMVVAGVLVGALLPVAIFHWDALFQLDSGPLWFVGAVILADRRLLPGSWAVRPLIGFAFGVIALSLRDHGYGIEMTLLTAAGLQAIYALVVITGSAAAAGREAWTRSRRLRRRQAQLRVVEGSAKAV